MIHFRDFSLTIMGTYLPMRSHALNIVIKTSAYLKSTQQRGKNSCGTLDYANCTGASHHASVKRKNMKKKSYQVPRPCDPVSSDRNPGKIDRVKTYVRKISSA